jgi:glucose-6-phosphate dehydrogenase assembly protein OpcA
MAAAVTNDDDLHKAAAGADLPVDYAQIERALSELWRSASEDDNAITRAALWNVVAHTDSTANHAIASETLARVSATIPQRTVVIRAEPAAPPEMSSWISANCHRIGDGKQVCSEEIAVVAGGERVRRIAPLVSALLIPDMPVAIWWLGDLPNEEEHYVQALFDPADRLIVDSADFDRAGDLDLLARIGESTSTAPSDLNWVRLEEWRMATASLFDPREMRKELAGIRRVGLTVARGEGEFFGHRVEPLLYLAWLSSQNGSAASGNRRPDSAGRVLNHEIVLGEAGPRAGALQSIEIELAGGTLATIRRDPISDVLNARVNGIEQRSQTVTRAQAGGTAELIVRQLKRPEGDPIYRRVLAMTSLMARRGAA